MKKILPCILVISLLLGGCGIIGERMREPVTFYYLRADLEALGPGEDMIVGEAREAAGHRNDLSYLMALYLMRPTNEELCVPLPRGTRISSAIVEDDTVYLKLSDTEKTMTDIEYSLACTCLSMTCMELTNAQAVNITSGDRNITMTRESLVLQDNTPVNATEDSK